MTTGQIWLAILGAIATVLGAIVAGIFGLRQAGKTAQPNVQSAINAGFTALTERQVQEITDARKEMRELKELSAKQSERIDRQDRKIAEQDRRITQQDLRISAMHDRENRFQGVIRRLVEHVHALRGIISGAGLAVPDDPVDPAELAELLDDTPPGGVPKVKGG